MWYVYGMYVACGVRACVRHGAEVLSTRVPVPVLVLIVLIFYEYILVLS